MAQGWNRKEASVIAETATAQRQVEAADRLPDLLATACVAFGVLSSGCRACEEQGGELFAAFAFAAAMAEQGRLALVAAPSLPPGVEASARPGLFVHDDLDEIADAFADLGETLHRVLAAAARAAAKAGDRAACEQAADEAAELRRLLAGDKS